MLFSDIRSVEGWVFARVGEVRVDRYGRGDNARRIKISCWCEGEFVKEILTLFEYVSSQITFEESM